MTTPTIEERQHALLTAQIQGARIAMLKSKPWITAGEACELLAGVLSLTKFYELDKAGRGPAFHYMFGKRCITPQSLLDWFDALLKSEGGKP